MRSISSLIIVTCLWLGTPVMADNIVGDKVVLRALDKVTATTRDYTVSIDDTLIYGSLEIDVRHCEKKPPEEIPEVYAFLQIYEKGSADSSDADSKAGMTPSFDALGSVRESNARPSDGKLFSGWMLASKPAVSALEHPVYDVWVLDCLPN